MDKPKLSKPSPILFDSRSCQQLSNRYLPYSEYFPQNIMFDKRVARGSTYAAMVIPAGQNPDQLASSQKEE